MSIDWEKLQTERLENIQEWYIYHFQHSEFNHLFPVVGYMVLWAVFNAIYNLAYLPKRKFKGVKREFEYKIPKISYISITAQGWLRGDPNGLYGEKGRPRNFYVDSNGPCEWQQRY